MSVNWSAPNISFPSFLRGRTHKYPSSIPYHLQPYVQTQPPLPKMSDQNHTIANDPLQPSQEIEFGAYSSQLGFEPDTTFDDLSYDDEMDWLYKESASIPMFQQVMPATWSFRPVDPSDNSFSAAAVPKAPTTMMPPKIENSPPLPTPTVLSQPVDASKYEAVGLRDWVYAATDYAATSPFSEDTAGSSPIFSDEGEWFVDHWHKKHPMHSVEMLHAGSAGIAGAPYGSNAALESNYSTAQTSPAISCNETNIAVSGLPLPDYMFGHPPIVPPIRFNNTYQRVEAASASPQDIERPASSHSDSAHSIASTSQLHHQGKENADEHHHRDQLLLDMRRENMSYREIKRVGKFTEAESTLRGRVRMLTKDKSERVRKPQWTKGDVGLLNDAVLHFAKQCSTSKRRAFRKIPWKKASQWMKDRGSSYKFAPATCAKKWEEVNGRH